MLRRLDTYLFTCVLLVIFPFCIQAQDHCSPGNEVTINFDELIQGESLPAGTLVNSQYASIGVMISAESGHPDVDSPIIFDSSCPGGTCSGSDYDLGTPNELYGGPGVGSGGASNMTALNNVLIIPEDLVDNDDDGLVDDPDDDGNGGIITFVFSSPVEITHLDFIDVEDNNEESVHIVGLKEDDSDAFPPMQAANLGNNSYQRVFVPLHGTTVKTLRLNFDDTSGALGELKICKEICVPDACGVCNGPGPDECGQCPQDPYYGFGRDECGLCPDDDDYKNAKDECGICFGDNSSCADCLGEPNGDNVIDDCGLCVPPDQVNADKDDCGVCFGGNEDQDICGVCFGDGTTCSLCEEVDITQTLFDLDGLAFSQDKTNKRLIRLFRKLSGRKNALTRLFNESATLYQVNWGVTWEDGVTVITDCGNPLCVAVSNVDRITEYAVNSDRLSDIGKSVFKKIKRKFGVSRRARRLNRERRSLAEQDTALLEQVPVEAFDCG